MTVNWLACSITYQIINFVIKYLPGNLLLNNTMSSISEIVANLLGVMLVPAFGAVRGL
jgi:hypothetical protein